MRDRQSAVDAAGVTVKVSRGRRKEPYRALDTIDLEARHGEITCLLGPNGSGKTTLMNVLTGLLRPGSGDLRVLGLDPVADRRELLRRIALVPQETSLYPELTARENLEFHARYYGLEVGQLRARVDETLELVQLGGRAGDRGGTFSGGMQRRLALGKALMMKPELLLLDEPTLGVDVQSREAIWTRIEEVAGEGRAVLLTTNYMEEAQRLGHDITIIDQGANVVRGTLGELTAQVPDVERVEVPAVGLQDVFLHFTGRGLRN